MLTCIHQPAGTPGLCRACWTEYAEDVEAFIEFGPHAAGLERWHAEEARIAADLAELEAEGQPPEPDPSIPF